MRKWPPQIMNKAKTLKYIDETKCSIARFGDGEVSLMAFIGIGFQRISIKLRKELINVSRNSDKNLLVCLPIMINDMSEIRESSRKWWISNLRIMKPIWKHYFSNGQLFGDTEITRPWLETQNETVAKNCFDILKQQWSNKDIVLIEGEKSRVGIGNDFFDNAKSIKRILCPAKNAYSKIEEIYEEALKQPKDILFLLALGPTATVLAYRLSKQGYRALDIGHMDIEYEWFKMKATEKVPVKNKYVNEAGGFKTLVEDDKITEIYKNQIIKVIK